MSDSARDAAGSSGWRCRAVEAIGEIGKAAWDACAFPESSSQAADSTSEPHDSTSEAAESPLQIDHRNPFISFDFLSSLEASGCVGGRTGWLPRHLVLEDASGAVIGVSPCYAKLHSQGEYVFDHSWADAYARAGGEYYPKLQVAVPFTPATGPRFLIRAGVERAAAIRALAAGLRALRDGIGASSTHATFLPESEARTLEAEGWLLRNDHQFHWTNEGYASFDDFLARLASRKRKAIRKERAEALAPGISIEWLSGAAIQEEHWDAFFAFYMDTGSRKWGRPYLNRRFFSLVGAAMAEKIVLIMARREGLLIAGAINFIGETTLYGRNWGAIEHHPFLHFEVCYYQAIDFAIAKGLTRVEAGAQGEHKLARGYLPCPTWSAHDIAHGGLRRAVADYLKRERAHIAEMDEALLELAPFRKGA